MKKEKEFGILLCIQILFPISIIIFLLVFFLTSQKVFLGVAIFIGVIYIFIRITLKEKLAQARQEKDYDEFGRAKKLKNTKQISAKERREIDLQKLADTEAVLSSTALLRMTKEGSKCPKQELENMTALFTVKEKIEEMVARMEFEKNSNGTRNSETIGTYSGKHMIFYGSAGVGKTTVAKIVTGFLYKYGYIKENKMIECDGNFLKAGSQTATKVSLVIHEAYGGVLFIDEAYALGEGAYSKEAIATLIKEMEDNRDKFVVILAGYTKEMKEFLSINTGFESRIKEYIIFPDYSSVELRDIFTKMANEKNFVISNEAYERFDERMIKERSLPSFGNGRCVRNVLDESIDKHALNYKRKIISEDKKYVLCPEDISVSLKRKGI